MSVLNMVTIIKFTTYFWLLFEIRSHWGYIKWLMCANSPNAVIIIDTN